MTEVSSREEKLSRPHSKWMLRGFRVFVQGSFSRAPFGLGLLGALLWLACFSAPVANAGCHDFSDDFYRSYHHGFNGLEKALLSTTRSVSPQVQWTYEDGEFRAIDRPLPPLCQGPQCRNSPVEKLGTMAPVEYQRTVTSAMRATDAPLLTRDGESQGGFSQASSDLLAGFPNLLDEPPR